MGLKIDGAIMKMPGTLHLSGGYSHDSEDKKYDRKFIVQVKANKPKKINRSYTFYVSSKEEAESIVLLYLHNNKIEWTDTIHVSANKNGDLVFNLIAYLQSKQIEYIIPEYQQLSWNQRFWMCRELTFRGFGGERYRSSNSIGLDGSGDGYVFYLYPGWLSFNGIGINRLDIHSYDANSIYHVVEAFLQNRPGDVSTEEFDKLLTEICTGNEIRVSTDNVDVLIMRHYSSGIRCVAFSEELSFRLPISDHKHSLKPNAELLEKVESSYVLMIKELIRCKSSDEAKQILYSYTNDIINNL